MNSEKEEKKNSKVLPKTLGVLGILGVLGAGSYFGIDSYLDSQKINVPSAVKFIDYGTEIDTACDAFEDVSLSCNVTWKINEDASRGNLLFQSIASGEKVAKNSNIELVYSKGKKENTMPDFTDYSLDKVIEEFYNMGLTVGAIKEVDNSNLDKNKVVATSVEAGAIVESGATVDIEVSSGSVEIPNWLGKTKEFVEADSTKNGFNVVFTEEESTETSGTIISQSPEPGSTEKVKAIELKVAKSFENKDIVIPDVLTKTPEEAQTELAVAGFRKITTVEVPNSEVKSIQVTQVVPEVGKTAKTDDNIVIIVSVPSEK